MRSFKPNGIKRDNAITTARKYFLRLSLQIYSPRFNSKFPVWALRQLVSWQLTKKSANSWYFSLNGRPNKYWLTVYSWVLLFIINSNSCFMIKGEIARSHWLQEEVILQEKFSSSWCSYSVLLLCFVFCFTSYIIKKTICIIYNLRTGRGGCSCSCSCRKKIVLFGQNWCTVRAKKQWKVWYYLISWFNCFHPSTRLIF